MFLQQGYTPATARLKRVFQIARVEAKRRGNHGAGAACGYGADKRRHLVGRMVGRGRVGHIGRAAFLRHGVPVSPVA